MGRQTKVQILLDGITDTTTSDRAGGGSSDQNDISSFVLKGSGDFNGGSIIFEADFEKDGNLDSDNWAPITKTETGDIFSFSSPFCFILKVKAGVDIRAKFTGSGASVTLKRL